MAIRALLIATSKAYTVSLTRTKDGLTVFDVVDHDRSRRDERRFERVAILREATSPQRFAIVTEAGEIARGEAVGDCLALTFRAFGDVWCFEYFTPSELRGALTP